MKLEEKQFLNDYFKFEVSQEQETVLDALINKQNSIINAVAGAGKTTLVMLLAVWLKKFKPGSKIIHLTYNKVLAEENKDKADKLGINTDKKNRDIIDSRTIHSFAGLVIKDQSEATKAEIYKNGNYMIGDEKVSELLKFDFVLSQTTQCDYLIIDEAQDLNAEKFVFLQKVYEKSIKKPVLVFIGDENQAINDYVQASKYFLTNADFLLENEEFSHFYLKESYRMPSNLTNFYNEAFLQKDHLVGKNPNFGKVAIINKDWNDLAVSIVNYVKDKMKKENATENDFLFLSFSAVWDNFARTVSNALINEGFSVYFPKDDKDNSAPPKTAWKNKIVFSTVHQAKGRERKYVILPNFSLRAYENWLQHPYQQSEIINKVPNLHYVALTRFTKEILINVSDKILDSDNSISFARYSNLMPYINYKYIKQVYKENEENSIQNPFLDLQCNFNTADRLLNVARKDFIASGTINPSKLGQELPATVLNRVKSILEPIISLDKSLEPYKTNLPSKIIKKENGKKTVYFEEVTITNSLYLLENYLYNFQPVHFENDMQMFANYILGVENGDDGSKLTNKHREMFSYFSDYREIGSDPSAFFKNRTTADKLRFLSYYLIDSISSFTNSSVTDDTWLQLPNYNWLDDFNEYDNIYTMFKYFDLKETAYETSFELYLTNLKGSENEDGLVVVGGMLKEGSLVPLWNQKDHENDPTYEITPFSVFQNANFNPNNIDFDIRIKGRIDLLNENILFELKNTEKISDDNLIQTLLYLFAHNLISGAVETIKQDKELAKGLNWLGNPILAKQKEKAVILNYHTGQVLIIKNDLEKINEAMCVLLNDAFVEDNYNLQDVIKMVNNIKQRSYKPENKQTEEKSGFKAHNK